MAKTFNIIGVVGGIVCVGIGLWYGLHNDYAQGTYFLVAGMGSAAIGGRSDEE